MTQEKRIEGFVRLGEKIMQLSEAEMALLAQKASNENPWFTPENIRLSLSGIGRFLQPSALGPWVRKYAVEQTRPKKVGVAMAGNIPLVGFHDLLCVLMAGHKLIAKVSSQDSVLMHFIKDSLIEINSDFADYIFFEERLNGVEAMIATGSDNTSRYFEYYFRQVPHIIRKNRSSCAVILGEENLEEYTLLGKDIFSYFGLGCRNVSKLYVPSGFDFVRLLDQLTPYKDIVHHHKYVNNYDYQKSILLVNQTHFYDTGFLLLTENQNLVSPIAVVYYEYYENQEDLNAKIAAQKDKLQCIVSAQGWYTASIPFGEAQLPAIDDYADGVDTMTFLQSV
ncbi:MAG: acyl-CoA reductase [Bacteroidetes bacterium]|nr:acyl-CoA reductase [Bacteroidota bacterium]